MKFTVTDAIILAVSVALFLLGAAWFRAINKHIRANPDTVTKGKKRTRILSVAISVFGVYLAATRIIDVVFGKGEEHEFGVELWAEPKEFLGLHVSVTIVNTWIVMAAVIALALLLRVTVLRRKRMTDVPHGAQNVIELCVEQMLKYMNSTVHGLGEVMGSYLFSVAVLLVGCAVLEMFGTRTPASDLTFTASLAIITFFLINWYGVKKKGASGRIKSLMQPTPVVLPIKIITDFAIPVSLASRLFGNMLGGMIVMDLLYSALGNNALGIPSAVGLFFNVFHPLLQAFIFITLTLTFISEAVE